MEKFKSRRNTPFSIILGHTLNVILGFIPRIHAEHLANVILGLVPRIYAEHNLNRHYRACPDNLDPRVEPEDDNRKRMCFKPEDDKGLRLSTSIVNHLSSVILGFIPRIHAEHTPLDPRVKPEDDNRKRMCFNPENDHNNLINKSVFLVSVMFIFLIKYQIL